MDITKLAVIVIAALVMIGTIVAIFFILKKKKNAAVPLQAGLVLKCVSGALSGKSYSLSGVLYINADSARNSVRCENTPNNSGICCKIVSENGRAQLTDVGTAAGTFLNGVKIEPNLPYPMPVGSSFSVGSPDQIFVITEDIPRPKKRFLPIVLIGAAVLLAAALLIFLLIRNQNTSATETYTGVTGNAIAIPDLGYAHILLNGEERTTDAPAYYWYEEKYNVWEIKAEQDDLILWVFDTFDPLREVGASFDLLDEELRDFDDWGISVLCNHKDYVSKEQFDEAILTVLSADENEIIFYFYEKTNGNEGYPVITLEGVVRAVPRE